MRRSSAFGIMSGSMVCIVALLVIGPFLEVLVGSVVGPRPVSTATRRSVALSGYTALLREPWVLRSALVTVVVTASGTFVSLSATTMAAYGLSRRSLPGRRALGAFVFVPLVFSGGLVPLYVTVRAMGLIDTFAALILPFSVSLINLHVMQRYYGCAETFTFQEWVKIVTTSKDVDSDWTRFVGRYRELGGDRLIAEMNDAIRSAK